MLVQSPALTSLLPQVWDRTSWRFQVKVPLNIARNHKRVWWHRTDCSPPLYPFWRKVFERTMYSAVKGGSTSNSFKVPLNKALNSKFLQGCCIPASPVLCEDTPLCIYKGPVCRIRHSRYLTTKRRALILRFISNTAERKYVKDTFMMCVCVQADTCICCQSTLSVH